jgi:hypothetical protein
LKRKSPKLPLTDGERSALRKLKIRLAEIADQEPEQLAVHLGITFERARFLVAQARFQQLPDIGPRGAKWLTDLGYSSLEELAGEDPAEMLNRLETFYGCWVDPCVEDCLRMVVHYAEHPDSDKRWFDFTEERKQFREAHGYPADRPTRSWMDKQG